MGRGLKIGGLIVKNFILLKLSTNHANQVIRPSKGTQEPPKRVEGFFQPSLKKGRKNVSNKPRENEEEY